MNYKTFLLIHGVIYSTFALVLFFVPTLVWPMYGLEINDKYAYFLSQHTSIFLGGLGAVSFFLRSIKDAETIRQLIKALITSNLLGVVITSYAGITGIFVGFGWSDPVFFAALAILGYLQLNRQSK